MSRERGTCRDCCDRVAAAGRRLTVLAGDRPRRAEVLTVLRKADGPLGAPDVARRVGVHVNTARFHLDALVAEGTVVRVLERPSGPGRPRTVYTPRPGMNPGGTRSYRLLAEVLLSHLSSSGPDAEAIASQAGRAWGGYLAGRPQPFQQVTAGEAIATLTALMGDLGFDPELETAGRAATIRLRHCPFLELAERYGQLVCRIHLGLLQGTLHGLGAPVTATALEPFAEPGACLAHLELASAA